MNEKEALIAIITIQNGIHLLVKGNEKEKKRQIINDQYKDQTLSDYFIYTQIAFKVFETKHEILMS